MRQVLVIVAALSVVGVIASVSAQQAGFTRTVLQQVDISVPGREVVTAVATLQAGASSGRHTHPGEEIAYILEGNVVVEQDGKPPLSLEAGKAFFIPAGVVHSATNRGSGVVRVLANYVVEKGKPTASPAAAPAKP